MSGYARPASARETYEWPGLDESLLSEPLPRSGGCKALMGAARLQINLIYTDDFGR